MESLQPRRREMMAAAAAVGAAALLAVMWAGLAVVPDSVSLMGRTAWSVGTSYDDKHPSVFVGLGSISAEPDTAEAPWHFDDCPEASVGVFSGLFSACDSCADVATPIFRALLLAAAAIAAQVCASVARCVVDRDTGAYQRWAVAAGVAGCAVLSAALGLYGYSCHRSFPAAFAVTFGPGFQAALFALAALAALTLAHHRTPAVDAIGAVFPSYLTRPLAVGPPPVQKFAAARPVARRSRPLYAEAAAVEAKPAAKPKPKPAPKEPEIPFGDQMRTYNTSLQTWLDRNPDGSPRLGSGDTPSSREVLDEFQLMALGLRPGDPGVSVWKDPNAPNTMSEGEMEMLAKRAIEEDIPVELLSDKKLPAAFQAPISREGENEVMYKVAAASWPKMADGSEVSLADAVDSSVAAGLGVDNMGPGSFLGGDLDKGLGTKRDAYGRKINTTTADGVAYASDMALPPPSLADAPGIVRPTGFWDPWGLSQHQTAERLKYFQEAEIKHGRLAMLASVGYLLAETYHPLFGGNIDGQSYDAFQQTPLEPFWLPVVFALGILEQASIKNFKSPGLSLPKGKNLWQLKDDHIPGDLGFDPMGVKPSDPEAFKTRQTREISNGRLAMLAIAGMVGQEAANPGIKLMDNFVQQHIDFVSVSPMVQSTLTMLGQTAS